MKIGESGMPDGSVHYVMLFNILHAESPRGPSMEIRPRPGQCRAWAEDVGFRPLGGIVQWPPYHYGMVFERPPGTKRGVQGETR